MQLLANTTSPFVRIARIAMIEKGLEIEPTTVDPWADDARLREANAATREISQALDSGKHTTTHASLYQLDADSALIDSPGLQEFGLGHLERGEIEQAFPEFRPILGHCRFRDCRHDREPDCALTAALTAGRIDPRRFAAYCRIVGQVPVEGR